jgi:hypothetical protein
MARVAFEKMIRLDDYELPGVVEKAVEDGELTKPELGELLERRVILAKRSGESYEQAYSRLLVEADDFTGARLFKLYRAMRGLEPHQEALKKAALEPKAPKPDDSPAGAIDRLAAEYRRTPAGAKLSQAQAFDHIATSTPEGIALMRQAKEADQRKNLVA